MGVTRGCGGPGKGVSWVVIITWMLQRLSQVSTNLGIPCHVEYCKSVLELIRPKWWPGPGSPGNDLFSFFLSFALTSFFLSFRACSYVPECAVWSIPLPFTFACLCVLVGCNLPVCSGGLSDASIEGLANVRWPAVRRWSQFSRLL